MQLVDPFPGKYDASDPFGSHGYGRTNGHTGSDWIVGAGSPIPAIGDGEVVAVGWHPGNGNYLAVRLEDGHVYAYLHMDRPAPVTVGQKVTRGQTIGYVGNTGTNSQGSHLHITISDAVTAYIGLGHLIDPWQFIQDHLTTAPLFEGDTVLFIRIQSTARGIALIGPGYFRQLKTDEEVQQSDPLISKHLTGNDRQFDLWRSMAVAGQEAKSA
ncbi:M23 family metallopeptidase [Leifsonia poae]|uniref:M23 family metallopeptidase n=1 Tax=Leifsonia poae TaxID=110933 RepID=UPI001CBA9218|nr:M23 family metallopeptidase [Leifsonia poae]